VFTGIVEEVGSLAALEFLTGNAARIRVVGPLMVSDATVGCSIAVSGVCLTVTDFDHESFTADVMSETIDHTSLGKRLAGDRVNLERAVQANGRLGGHVVSGHVDCVGEVLARTVSQYWEVIRFSVDRQHARQIALKGSITIDGVSLTISGLGQNEAGTDWFEVSLIPTTLAETTLGGLVVGQQVNLETDVLAKYVQRLLEDGTDR
jgi:riboflavin synthase